MSLSRAADAAGQRESSSFMTHTSVLDASVGLPDEARDSPELSAFTAAPHACRVVHSVVESGVRAALAAGADADGKALRRLVRGKALIVREDATSSPGFHRGLAASLRSALAAAPSNNGDDGDDDLEAAEPALPRLDLPPPLAAAIARCVWRFAPPTGHMLDAAAEPAALGSSAGQFAK